MPITTRINFRRFLKHLHYRTGIRNLPTYSFLGTQVFQYQRLPETCWLNMPTIIWNFWDLLFLFFKQRQFEDCDVYEQVKLRHHRYIFWLPVAVTLSVTIRTHINFRRVSKCWHYLLWSQDRDLICADIAYIWHTRISISTTTGLLLIKHGNHHLIFLELAFLFSGQRKFWDCITWTSKITAT